MLSISVIKSSASATTYYEKDDYYTGSDGEEGNSAGQWYGKVAEGLGLSGAVDPATFKAVLDGELPNGETIGKMINGERQHTPGWDLTFSAPKSVSIMNEVGGDKRLQQAHDKAVLKAVGWLEKELAVARVTKDGVTEKEATNGIVAALFQHSTSRNQDAQTHTHVVIANATERKDGTFASIDSKAFFDYKMAMGNIYRSELARDGIGAGYDIDKTHTDGRFEFKQVPDAVRGIHSTRSDEIKASLTERGLEGAKMAEQAALKTRSRKEVMPRSELEAKWRDINASVGFNAKENIPVAGKGKGPEEASLSPEDAVKASVLRLATREHVFSDAKLIQWSLAESMGKGNIDDVQRVIKDLEKAGHLEKVPLGKVAGWTTPKARGVERVTLQTILDGRDAAKPIAAGRAVDKAIALHNSRSEYPLTDGQRSAVQLISTSKDRFIGIRGAPGVGKTTLLGVARDIAEQNGKTMIGLAQNAEAARLLKDDAGIKDSGTIASFIQRVGPDVAKMVKGNVIQQATLKSQYSKQVWTVDEASQMNSKDGRTLTRFAERLGAKVVFMGDDKQLPAIDAGKPLAQAIRGGMNYVEVTQNVRQREEHHKEAAMAVREDRIEDALNLLHKETQEIKDPHARGAKAVDLFFQSENRQGTQIITATNQRKTQFNDIIRERLRESGELGKETIHGKLDKVPADGADTRSAIFYKEGQIVRFGSTSESMGITKGDHFKVTGTDPRTNNVKLTRIGENSQDKNKDDKSAKEKPDKVLWNPRKFGQSKDRGVQIYEAKEKTIATDETIRWKLNLPELGLKNNMVLKVLSNDNGVIEVKKPDGQTVKVDTSRASGQHWDHNYATTNYSSQGMTAKTSIVEMDSTKGSLSNMPSAVVGLTRQSNTIHVLADDKEKVVETAKKHLGQKTSAIEATDQRTRQDGQGRQSEASRLSSRLFGHLDKPSQGKAKDSPTPEQQGQKQPDPTPVKDSGRGFSR